MTGRTPTIKTRRIFLARGDEIGSSAALNVEIVFANTPTWNISFLFGKRFQRLHCKANFQFIEQGQHSFDSGKSLCFYLLSRNRGVY